MSVLLKAMKRAAAEKGRVSGQASSAFTDTGSNPVYAKSSASSGRRSFLGVLFVLMVMAGVFLGALALMSGSFERRVEREAVEMPVLAVAVPDMVEASAPDEPEDVSPGIVVSQDVPVIEPLMVEVPGAPPASKSFIYVHPMQEGVVPDEKPAKKAPEVAAKPVVAKIETVEKVAAVAVAEPEVPVAPVVEEVKVAAVVAEPVAAPEVVLQLVPAGLVSGMAGALREPAWSQARFDDEVPVDMQARLSWAADLVRKNEVPQAMSLYDGLRTDYPDRTEPDIAQVLALRRYMPDSPELSIQAVRLEQAARGVAVSMARDKALRKPGRVLISRFMDAHPDAALVASQAGSILVENGDAEDGMALLEQAQTLTPADGLHAYNLGVALARAGKTEAARQMFVRALETSDGADLPLPVDAIKAWLAAHP